MIFSHVEGRTVHALLSDGSQSTNVRKKSSKINNGFFDYAYQSGSISLWDRRSRYHRNYSSIERQRSVRWYSSDPIQRSTAQSKDFLPRWCILFIFSRAERLSLILGTKAACHQQWNDLMTSQEQDSLFCSWEWFTPIDWFSSGTGQRWRAETRRATDCRWIYPE